MPPGCRAFLLPHPAAACPAVESIEVAVEAGEGNLVLRYRLRGRIGELVIPDEAPPAFADGLWEHTCFEAFAALPGEAAYREFNFSPSGQWAAYAFSGYRQRVEGFPPPAAPAVACRHDGTTLELEAQLPALLLPAGSALELGLTAVVASRDGSRSYWALAHGDDRPDFHRRDTFRFALNTPTP